uniref:beta-N-acetylhexosaminidase n=1 Tax=uncultured Alphaproteobacteria bacterium TaxID=91750 RepID=A0A6G8F326_9PROT|nr:glycosyl hydrolase [uncultured Alphaproteobacteria bacterium]
MTAALIVSVAGLALEREEKKLLEKMQPAGVSLFGRNIADKKQLCALVREIKDLIGDDALIAVDQEGGRVRRLAEPHWRSYVSQYVLGQLPDEICRMHALLVAEDLHECGINFNYAPVLDTLYPQTHEVLKSRCFTQEISQKGKIMIDAYADNGICPCIKHMPGHGRAAADPHLGLPVVNCSLSEFQKDLKPFYDNNKAPAGMTAHIVVSEVDSLPVTMSSKAIREIIRGAIGFDGLLISDAIDMGALNGTIAERAEKVLAAGCDLVCYCGGKTSELCDLAALGTGLSEESKSRLNKVKDIIKRRQRDFADYDIYKKMVGQVKAYAESYDATEVLNQMNR